MLPALEALLRKVTLKLQNHSALAQVDLLEHQHTALQLLVLGKERQNLVSLLVDLVPVVLKQLLKLPPLQQVCVPLDNLILEQGVLVFDVPESVEQLSVKFLQVSGLFEMCLDLLFFLGEVGRYLVLLLFVLTLQTDELSLQALLLKTQRA